MLETHCLLNELEGKTAHGFVLSTSVTCRMLAEAPGRQVTCAQSASTSLLENAITCLDQHSMFAPHSGGGIWIWNWHPGKDEAAEVLASAVQCAVGSDGIKTKLQLNGKVFLGCMP